MNISKKKNIFNDHFILFTAIYSAIAALLYVLRGITEGFLLGTCIIIALNIIYIPLAIIFKKRGIAWFYLIYALILTVIISFEKSFLFNNFTAVFLICIVFMIHPKLKIPAVILYFVTATIAFILNEEDIIHYLIHICISLWFIQVVSYVLYDKFDRKKLILYDDEKMILDQLCEGKVYQKEVVGFSENTIYRKLKAARERNGNLTRNQLVDLYRKEKEMTNS